MLGDQALIEAMMVDGVGDDQVIRVIDGDSLYFISRPGLQLSDTFVVEGKFSLSSPLDYGEELRKRALGWNSPETTVPAVRAALLPPKGVARGQSCIADTCRFFLAASRVRRCPRLS